MCPLHIPNIRMPVLVWQPFYKSGSLSYFWFSEEPDSWACNLWCYTGPCVWFDVLLLPTKILNNFSTSSPTFSSCTGTRNYIASTGPQKSVVIYSCHNIHWIVIFYVNHTNFLNYKGNLCTQILSECILSGEIYSWELPIQ